MYVCKEANGSAGHEQPPSSGHQPPHHPRHRGHKPFRKEAGALDMDTVSDASAAASLLTVLLEQSLSAQQQSQLVPVLRCAICHMPFPLHS